MHQVIDISPVDENEEINEVTKNYLVDRSMYFDLRKLDKNVMLLSHQGIHKVNVYKDTLSVLQDMFKDSYGVDLLLTDGKVYYSNNMIESYAVIPNLKLGMTTSLEDIKNAILSAEVIPYFVDGEINQ